MTLASSTISLTNLRFHARHGVMPQEQAVGGDFVLSLHMDVPLGKAMTTDAIGDTVSYADVYAIIRREMAVPSQLLEHVAGRIAHALMEAFPQIEQLQLTLTKKNPPMGADGGDAGVTVRFTK